MERKGRKKKRLVRKEKDKINNGKREGEWEREKFRKCEEAIEMNGRKDNTIKGITR